MKQITYEQALNRLAAYCSRAERCRADIRKKCQAWELPDEEQARLIARLEKERFLDEARYARAFVNDKSQYSRWGANKIRYALKLKGIPSLAIDEALSGIDREASREQLKQLLQQKQRTVKGKDAYEIRQKLIRFALGRGFPLDDILRELPLDC